MYLRKDRALSCPIHRAIKGSTLEIFKDCSHMTMNEQPAKYVASLRRFLA